MPAANGLELERRTRELYSLGEVAKTLTAALDLPELLGAVMDKLSRVLEPAEAGAIMLWDQASGLFRAGAAFGYDLQILREMGLRAGESITGKAYDKGVAHLLATPAEVAEAMLYMRPPTRTAMARALGADAAPRSALAVP